MYQDCFICKDPLHVDIYRSTTEKHHLAVRIDVCGHMHGHECLMAWLDTGNSCPTCKRLLFENSGRGVSQSDIGNVVHSLRHMFGEKRVVSAIARLVGKQDVAQAQLRRTHEEERKKMKAKEAQAHREDIIDDDEWMISGDEEGTGDYEGDDDYKDTDMSEDEDKDDKDDDEDDDFHMDKDEDVEPQSATA